MPEVKPKTRRRPGFACRRPVFPVGLWKIGVVLLSVFVGFRGEAPGQTPAVTWGSRDSTLLDVPGKQVRLFGAAWVAYGDVRLEAERIVYHNASRTVCATGLRDSSGTLVGRPVLTQGGQRFEQDSLCFNLDTQRGLAHAAVTVQGEAVFHATLSKRAPDGWIHVRDGKFTTCDAANPHFHFHLRRAIMVPGEKVVSGPFYLKFRKIPTPLALPFGWFPVPPEKRAHGLLMPGYGNGGTLGFFLKDLGYYVPLGPFADTRLTVDAYTGGSWAVNSLTNYNRRYRASGSFQASFQHRREGLPGVTGSGIQRTFFVRWSHTQDPRSRPNGRFSANVNLGSSDNFRLNLNSSQQDYLTNTFQSSVQYNANVPGLPLSLAASARHSQNSATGRVEAVLPSLTLNLNRTSLARLLGVRTGRSRFLDELALTGSSRFEQGFEAADSTLRAGDFRSVASRNGFKHTATASTSLRVGFVSVTPNVTYSDVWAFQTLERTPVAGTDTFTEDTLSGFVSAREWRAGVNATTRFYGTFQFRPDGRMPALRHVITPTLGLTYTPEFSRTRTATAGDQTTTWNPYALGRFTASDIAASGAVQFGLAQNLEAKIRDRSTGDLRKVRLIDNFSTTGSYNLVADSLRLSDLSTRLFTTLFGRIPVNLSTTHSAYDRDATGARIDRFLLAEGKGLARLTAANAAIGTRLDAPAESAVRWNAQLDYTVNLTRSWVAATASDTTRITQSLRFRGGVPVGRRFRVDADSGWDFVAREFTPTVLNLSCDLHCWEASLNVIPFGLRQSFTFRINIKAAMLRDLKLEARGSNGQLLF